MFAHRTTTARPNRRTRLLRTGVLGVLASLLLGLVATTAVAAVPGPIHAGNTYGWYWDHNVQRQEFHGSLGPAWHRHGSGTVRNQHGMITLETRRGTLSATFTGHAHRTGRWEVRLRSRRYETGHTDYRVVSELVPARSGASHCGAQNIGLESYAPGHHAARMYDRTLADNAFHARRRMTLHNDQWHTFAVEVTPRHISWFIDARVVHTERRPAALSGIPLAFRFSLVATPGHRMNLTRLQADWMRYWSYNRPSTRSIKAPGLQRGTYADAC
jgi:hypothetical protein